jgi:DNA-binding protein H-NS
MSNLIDIQGQIEKLQKQASDIRSREFDKTVQEILVTMQAFGISIKDLQSAGSKAAKSRAASSTKRGRTKTAKTARSGAGSTVAAKFRGPNGETWSGRGLMPRWMAALVAEGRQKEDFAIQS